MRYVEEHKEEIVLVVIDIAGDPHLPDKGTFPFLISTACPCWRLGGLGSSQTTSEL